MDKLTLSEFSILKINKRGCKKLIKLALKSKKIAFTITEISKEHDFDALERLKYLTEFTLTKECYVNICI